MSSHPADDTSTRPGEGRTGPADDIPVLHVRGGLPAFPGSTRFALVRWGGDDSPFSKLQSLDDIDLAFVVTEPSPFFPGYEPEIDDDDAERLGLASPDDALVLVIVTLGDAPADATANLLGPVVVNRRSLEAAQVVLEGDYTTRVPLVSV